MYIKSIYSEKTSKFLENTHSIFGASMFVSTPSVIIVYKNNSKLSRNSSLVKPKMGDCLTFFVGYSEYINFNTKIYKGFGPIVNKMRKGKKKENNLTSVECVEYCDCWAPKSSLLTSVSSLYSDACFWQFLFGLSPKFSASNTVK